MTETDKIIALALKNADIKVFEELFRSLYPALCGYALKMLKDPDQAEEIVQEMFFTFWKKRETLVINLSIKSYLYKSVYNKCLHYLEHQTVVANYARNYEQSTNAYYSPDDAMQVGEMYGVYKKTLSQLPERCREIFQMSRKYGLKYHEIAEELDLPIGTVKNRIHIARKTLKSSLKMYA